MKYNYIFFKVIVLAGLAYQLTQRILPAIILVLLFLLCYYKDIKNERV